MPTRDGRKNYWNHQLGSVTVAEGGGSCISPGGGHTDALLQIIDDTGTFQGWVGAEASFNARTYGNAVVAAFYYKRS
jgi:hypothetical protein